MNADTRAAVEYVRAGLALIPIPPGLKGPRTGDWNLEENSIRSEEQAAGISGNIGLAHRWCGTCAADVDDYHQALSWLEGRGIDLQELLLADDAVQVRSGRDNRAKLLYRLPDVVEWLLTLQPVGSGLELRCANRDGSRTVQNVIPPSVHPDTGKPYEWAGDWHHIPPLPDALLRLWRELSSGASGQGPRLGIEHDPVLQALDANGLVIGQIHGKLGGWTIRCPGESEHTGKGGNADTAYFEPHTNGYADGAFSCFHSHCADRGIRELREWLGIEKNGPEGHERQAGSNGGSFPPVPSLRELEITEAELRAARLTPTCIVKHYTYGDVGLLVSPGGTGKTTVVLYEGVHIELGLALYGLEIITPGRVVLVTAEDRREMLVARLRRVMGSMELSDEQHRHVLERVLIWDVTGKTCRLAEQDRDNNVVITGLADAVIDAFRDDPPVRGCV